MPVTWLVQPSYLPWAGRWILRFRPFYYTVPLRSVLAVLDGRNRKAALFVGK